LTPLLLQSEEGKAVGHHAAARLSCFCFKPEGQFLPSADWRPRSLPFHELQLCCQHRGSPSCRNGLCTTGACLFSFGWWGERRCLLEWSKGQCHLSGSLPSVIEQMLLNSHPWISMRLFSSTLGAS